MIFFYIFIWIEKKKEIWLNQITKTPTSTEIVNCNNPNEKILYFTTQNFTLLQKTLLHEKYFFYKTWAN